MAVLQRSDTEIMERFLCFFCFGWIILPVFSSSQEPHQKVETDARDVELGQVVKTDATSDASSRDSCESRERLLATRAPND